MMEATTAAALTEAEKDMVAGGMAIGGVLGVFLTAFFVLWILQIIAFWKIFKKAGEPGWKSIIPIYNSYVLYKISWRPLWFWLNILIAFIYGFVGQLANSSTSGTFFAILTIIFYVALFVLYVMFLVKISRSFGHGIGFAIGLLFLYPIFILMLGYGKSEYKGADL